MPVDWPKRRPGAGMYFKLLHPVIRRRCRQGERWERGCTKMMVVCQRSSLPSERTAPDVSPHQLRLTRQPNTAT